MTNDTWVSGHEMSELEVVITSIQKFLEDHGYESAILSRQRHREQAVAAREMELDKWERDLRERERLLQQAAAKLQGSGDKYLRQHCGQDVCGRTGPCYTADGPVHRHHSCDSCHRLWKQGKAKGSGRGRARSKAAFNMQHMD